MMLVDSHCHLNFPDFEGDVGEIIKRANENDVGIMQTICTKIHEFPDVLAIAEKYENVYASVGVHPHEAGKEYLQLQWLLDSAKHEKVIGIGETGLDYHYEHSPRKQQKESFLTHIEAARITGLPLIVHTREADDDTIEILHNEMKKGSFTGLIHCYSSSRFLAEKAMEFGFYISISGIITFKKSDALREVIKDIPLSKLMLETDSPFLAPTPFRGKRNEPAYTRNTAEFLANMKGISYEELAEITTNNFLSLFNTNSLSKPNVSA